MAILLFAQTAKVESGIKFFATNKTKNISLWNILNDRILKEVKKTKLDFFVFDENNQVGETFGNRITSAIENVFSKGFEKVIVVGNDCLDLKANQILKASANFNNFSTVLGPDNNGGTYLMGLSKSSFNSKSFTSISWQTDKVFSQLKLLYQSDNVLELQYLNDFNSNYFFNCHFKKLRFSSHLKKLLRVCLSSLSFNFSLIIGFFSIYFNTILFNKGSPKPIFI